jgi:hypothetical protein
LVVFVEGTIMIRFAALALLLAAPSAQDEWTPLFNGKDLTGWTPKIAGHALGENYNDTFRVENGAIKVSYDKYQKFENKFGHLFYKEPFSHYRIRIEYRFTGDQCPGGPGWALRNSGVMLHCQAPETLEKDQPFPVSIEAQFLGGSGKGERSTGNLCTPGTNVVIDEKLVTTHCLNSKSKTIHGDAWVTFEAEVRGSGAIKHFVDGDLVFSYGQPQYDPKDGTAKKLIKDPNALLIESGWISLQAESHPIEFRKVEIRKLEK